MKILEPGHVYQLHWLDGTPEDVYDQGYSNKLVFVNREPGHEHPGTQTQEVLRALIDRTYHCDSCLPSELNAMIIHHLRMALVYHEMRALQRKAEKGKYRPEDIELGSDGHFKLKESLAFNDPKLAFGDPMRAPRREFQLQPTQQACTYREYPTND